MCDAIISLELTCWPVNCFFITIVAAHLYIHRVRWWWRITRSNYYRSFIRIFTSVKIDRLATSSHVFRIHWLRDIYSFFSLSFFYTALSFSKIIFLLHSRNICILNRSILAIKLPLSTRIKDMLMSQNKLHVSKCEIE